VWQHAEYLKNHNRRPDYVTACCTDLNWTVIAKRFEKARGLEKAAR
jgi:Fe-Mn family superoxide dismutase